MRKFNLICCISAVVSISACRNVELRPELLVTPPYGNSRTVELAIADAEVRTAYAAGVGVNIDGTEDIAVLYSVKDTLRGSLKAVPVGSGLYSFTIPEGVEPDAMFYGVMPYSSAVAPITADKRIFKLRIFPVQYPGQNSFDAHYDFLSAEGFSIDDGKATINRFKRLISPLCLKITGLPDGTMIRTAELALDQGTSEETCTGLVGEAKVYATDNYRKSAVLSLANPGNSVSAIYPEGLAASNGEWNIWYIVNPSSLYAGSTLTVRISAGACTYIKDVVLPSNAEIRRNELSRVSVDMSGQDVRTLQSITFDFSGESVYDALQSGTSITLAGSDGNNYTLAFNRTKCSLKGEDGMPCAMQITSPEGTGKHLTLPSIKDKNIIAARLFAQIKSANTTVTEDSLVAVKNGREIAKVNANMCRIGGCSDYLGNTGGVAELRLPAGGAASLSGTQVQGRGSTLDFSAMTLVLQDKETPVYDPNDYLSMFEAGLDIEIAGKVFNIETYPTYTVCKMSEISDTTPITAAFTANGLVFIDNDAPDKVMLSSSANIAMGKDAVIIGRYISGKGQPRIAISKDDKYFQIQNTLHLLNVQVEHNSKYCFFTSKSGYSSLYCQDCTFLSTDQYGHGFIRYNAAGVGFVEVVVDNSIFIYGGGSGNTLYLINNASGGNTSDNFAQLKNFTVTNSVFIPLLHTASAVKTSIISAPQKTDNASFTLKNNSFYGMTAVTPKAILNLKSANAVTIQDNVFYSETSLSADLTHDLVKVSGTSGSVTVTGNWMNRYEDGGFSLSWNPAAGNNNSSAGSFFATEGISSNYLPVNKSVVTTPAGATYDTKKWNKWVQ